MYGLQNPQTFEAARFSLRCGRGVAELAVAATVVEAWVVLVPAASSLFASGFGGHATTIWE